MTGIARLLYNAKVDQFDPSKLLAAEDEPIPPARVWLDHEIKVAVEGHLAAAAAMGHLLEWTVDQRVGQVVVDPEAFHRDLDDRLFLALRDAERVLIEVLAQRCGDHVEIYVLGGAGHAPPLVLPTV